MASEPAGSFSITLDTSRQSADGPASRTPQCPCRALEATRRLWQAKEMMRTSRPLCINTRAKSHKISNRNETLQPRTGNVINSSLAFASLNAFLYGFLSNQIIALPKRSRSSSRMWIRAHAKELDPMNPSKQSQLFSYAQNISIAENKMTASRRFVTMHDSHTPYVHPRFPIITNFIHIPLITSVSQPPHHP